MTTLAAASPDACRRQERPTDDSRKCLFRYFSAVGASDQQHLHLPRRILSCAMQERSAKEIRTCLATHRLQHSRNVQLTPPAPASRSIPCSRSAQLAAFATAPSHPAFCENNRQPAANEPHCQSPGLARDRTPIGFYGRLVRAQLWVLSSTGLWS
jgi:hypothetical protein